MAFILKILSDDQSPVVPDNEHSLYADITAVHFSRHPDGSATARCYVREPIKTAEVPGFCENERLIGFHGVAYLMNEAGKTVSSFAARTSGDIRPAA